VVGAGIKNTEPERCKEYRNDGSVPGHCHVEQRAQGQGLVAAGEEPTDPKKVGWICWLYITRADPGDAILQSPETQPSLSPVGLLSATAQFTATQNVEAISRAGVC